MNSLSKLALVLCLTSLIHLPVFSSDEFEGIATELIDRAVVMQLPEGVRRIRLRIKDANGEWQSRTIAHLKGTEGFLKLRLPDGVEKNDIEVAASWSDPFPYEFYAGESKFEPSEGNGNTNRAGPTDAESGVSGDAETTVEESDIWKWRDGTLYFFNQYRGLQVIDASDPAAPKRLTTMRIPFSGEQMYLHPTSDQVVLLTYDGNTGNGQVLLVEPREEDTLEETASIPVPGYILESRMVGSVLYVVSRRWWQEAVTDPDSGVEHLRSLSGLAVTKIDLSDPAEPVVSDPLELRDGRFNYWGGIVQATADALLIATSEYNYETRKTLSTVHVVDISDPNEDPVLTHEIPTNGHVQNKFNLNLKDEILTVVSQVRRGANQLMRYASVETFDISEPSEGPVEAMAALEFANNESITASRFAGDLLYVVTVLRIDPLFVISLADPANPQLLGELEVPGFSTYLEPLGEDALISVGIEDRQIAVSWFDVSEPTNPSLASRVYIGEEDGWSWSEANWDEKAFGFFPDEGWALVPFQGYDPEKGSTSGMQLIELGDGELVKRGSIEHEFQARRARVIGEAVVSISGQSLKSLDISDPDHPILLAELTLAWPVDFVHRVGDYLVQLQRGPGFWYWGGNDLEAQLHVTTLDDTDERVASMALPEGRIVGTFLLDDCLIIAQSSFENKQVDEELWEYRDVFRTTIVDLSDPTAPVLLGTTVDEWISNQYRYYGAADYLGQLLEDGSLLWYPAEQNFYFFLEPGIADAGRLSGDFVSPYYSSGGKLYVVDLEDKSEPRIISAIGLSGDDSVEGKGLEFWSEGQIRVLDSVVYFGLQSSELIENAEGLNRWMARHWLGQIDLGNAAKPVRQVLVEIPGTFENVIPNGSGGRVLFSSIYRSYYEKEVWRNAFLIQASAFDGVTAYLIDELVDENSNYGPKLFEDEFVVLGRTDYSSGEPVTELITFEWLNSGSFLERPAVSHPGAIYRLGVVDDILVAPGAGELSFFDFSNPGDPASNSISFPSLYFWQRIELIDIYNRQMAYMPQGWYGVETLDFGGMFDPVEPSFELPGLQNDEAIEWVSVGLDILPLTRAQTGLLIGELEEDDIWLFAEGVEQLSYEDWMRRTLDLGDGETVPEESDDLDEDGLSNGFEYLLASNPNEREQTVSVESWIAFDNEGGRYLEFRIPQNAHAADSITLLPQFSYNLKDWMPFPEGFETSDEMFSTSKIVRMLEPVETVENLFIRFQLTAD